CDDAALDHPSREQDLSERVVDFVRASVREVFALKVDARAARVLREARSVEERRRSPGVVAQKRVELCVKARVVARGIEGGGQLFKRGHQGLRHVATAVRPPVSARVWLRL